MFDIDGGSAELIGEYLEDEENKFYTFVYTGWDDLTGYCTGAGRYNYQTVVNLLNYFAQNFHDESEKRAYRREIGLRKDDFTSEMIVDVVKNVGLLVGIILADTKGDYLEAEI